MKKTQKSLTSSSKKILFSFFIAIIGFVGLYFLLNEKEDNSKKNDSPSNEITNKDYSSLFDESKYAFQGKEDAEITVVEFFDFSCPACHSWYYTIYNKLKENYIDTSKVKFYSINFPFLSDGSTNAALLFTTIYEEVGSEEAYLFKDSIFKQIIEDGLTSENALRDQNMLNSLNDILSEKEIKKVKDSYKKKTYKNELQDQIDLGKKFEITGTPSVFVNGVAIKNSMDQEEIFNTLDSLVK